MLNLFKKTNIQHKIYYSCVIDDKPKFYLQGYYFILILINIAKVAGNRIFIHMTAKNSSFEKLISEYGVNIIHVSPWGDKKYCNKLTQLETPALLKADYVFLCDADILIVNDLAKLLPLDKIVGKVVDFDNPPLPLLKQVYKAFNIPFPEESTDTLNNKPTFVGNFNGGLYGVPGKYLKKFGDAWKDYATKILNSDGQQTLLKEKIIHTDQIAFSLALNSLKLPYHLLTYDMNCPTHIKELDILEQKLKSTPSVIHYHSNLTAIGMLADIELKLVTPVIKKINQVLSQNFNNELFWDFRYSTNPELGSGVGSRGTVAEYKSKLIKMIGIENDKSLLDIGCGDLEIIGKFKIDNYTGVDVSSEALNKAKQRYPNSSFYSYVTQKSAIPHSETVVCLDVTLHQPSKNDYQNLLNFITEKTTKRLIVSGYDSPSDQSHMCFFYEPLKESLLAQSKFKYVFKIGEYRNLSVYLADNGDLSKLNTPVTNDVSNEEIFDYLTLHEINKDHLLSAVVASRSAFGWFTKHKPRLIEFPWILEKFSYDMSDLKILDFGAGVTPLPIMFAQRNASVFTIDNHEVIRHHKDISKANEWGFFDYSVLFSNITSLNETFDENTFKENHLDVFYSISVIEHMPAEHRRNIISNLSRVLKPGGQVFLSVDLCKDSENLWNMSAGKVVEDPTLHGTFDDLLVELRHIGLTIIESKVIKLQDVERVDLALISAVLEQAL